MTIFWLVIWIFSGTPHVAFIEGNTTWGVALAVCVGIDLVTKWWQTEDVEETDDET